MDDSKCRHNHHVRHAEDIFNNESHVRQPGRIGSAVRAGTEKQRGTPCALHDKPAIDVEHHSPWPARKFDDGKHCVAAAAPCAGARAYIGRSGDSHHLKVRFYHSIVFGLVQWQEPVVDSHVLVAVI